jgi:predicted aminopeptidase
MNTNELADWLDNIANSKDWGELTKYYKKRLENASSMLLQQQAKLEKSQELLREYTALNMRQHAEIEALRNQLWDLKSEPWGFDRHPTKTLTNAEIQTIQDMCHLKNVGYNTFIMRFAKAILRKAQEK